MRTVRIAGTRGWVAIALALWLGGLSCLLGCAAQVAAVGHDHGQPLAATVGEDSCTDGCCKKGDPGSEPPSGGREHPAKEMDCCLAVAAPGVLAKVQVEFALAAQDSVAPMPAVPAQPAVWEHDVFLADSGGAYLKNRVLRI
jgi:hypothetical protein